eukprot:TRINITY_DN33850_c0_g1_i1.p1 TRINITY_DN33850_c0_g1~~TRINITY_DN33850_c0_g1_i1.p1  ORF type:complete len:254 (-),score=40.58 TRINITY_DN33850_c0_g1_i1:88-756(-)
MASSKVSPLHMIFSPKLSACRIQIHSSKSSCTTSFAQTPFRGASSKTPVFFQRTSLVLASSKRPNAVQSASEAPPKPAATPPKSSKESIVPDYLVKKVSGEEFEKLLDSATPTPLVVDFYATWCGPCVLMAQQVETLAVQYGETATFVKIDTDEEYELAQQLQIRGLPTVLLISQDRQKPAIRAEGMLPIETMRTLIETELGESYFIGFNSHYHEASLYDVS